MKRELKRPVGSFLYRKIHRFLNMRTIRERMRKIHVVPEDELTRLCEEYCSRILSNSLLVFFGTLVLSVGLAVYTNRTKASIVLNRESYGGDETVTQLETEINGEKQMISVDVLPLTYDAESIEEAFDKGFAYIDSVYLGTNENADHITEDLELIDSVDELGLRVSWEIEDESDIVDYRGEIIDHRLDEPVLVNLVATLSYEDFSASRNYPVKVAGREKNETEKAIETIQEALDMLQRKSDTSSLVLPETVAGYHLQHTGTMRLPVLVFVLGGIFSILLVYKEYSDIRTKEKKRNEELLMAYPSFVDLMSLYMGAGLTVKGSLSRAVVQSDSPVLAEELNYTLNEIQSGIPETEGYYWLSNRLALPVYQKIFTLLSQNIKKGTRDILNLLAEEEAAALQLKKELAKRKGEEAGTKLLFPMILQLGIVMIIVIAPALLGF